MSEPHVHQPGDVRPGRDSRSEDLFLTWLLRLPHTVDVAEQARIEIVRLDQARAGCDATMRLRDLLVQASAGPLAMPRGRSRSRH